MAGPGAEAVAEAPKIGAEAVAKPLNTLAGSGVEAVAKVPIPKWIVRAAPTVFATTISIAAAGVSIAAAAVVYAVTTRDTAIQSTLDDLGSQLKTAEKTAESNKQALQTDIKAAEKTAESNKQALQTDIKAAEKTAESNKQALQTDIKELKTSVQESTQALAMELRQDVRDATALVHQWSGVFSSRIDTATLYAADKAVAARHPNQGARPPGEGGSASSA